MNNLLESVKRFTKNKNTVTIIGVIAILVLLYIGYSMQIRNAVEPVSVPVATETIQPRTEITDDMVQIIDMPNISVGGNVITSKGAIVGKYSNVNSVIPEGSMFYTDTVIEKDKLPDASFTKVKTGEVVYNFPVDMESTYGNSIFPGNKIDIYMKVGDGAEEKVMIGKLIGNIEVLAVKDSSGKAVFENTEEERTPAMLLFGLSEEYWLLLRKASFLSSQGVEIFPVPQQTGKVDTTGATEVSTQQLADYINAHSVDIPVATADTNTTDSLMPTAKESGGNPNKVTITYPKGCGSTYTCTYQKDGGAKQAVTKTTQVVTFTSNGTLVATVTEKNGTNHTLNTNIPMTTNSTTENNG